MIQGRQIICEYCNTLTAEKESTCQACGGPLTHRKVELHPTFSKETPSGNGKQLQSNSLRKATDKADDIYFTLFNTYAIAWRTVGEAISIALSGLILGFLGGATQAVVPGIIGGILIGFAVGFTRKNFYLVIISAPAGLLFGIGAGILIWILGSQPQVMVYTGLAFSLLGALIRRGRNQVFMKRNCWEKSRPLLGAFGGFVFGSMGALLGWGLREIIVIGLDYL